MTFFQRLPWRLSFRPMKLAWEERSRCKSLFPSPALTAMVVEVKFFLPVALVVVEASGK